MYVLAAFHQGSDDIFISISFTAAPTVCWTLRKHSRVDESQIVVQKTILLSQEESDKN